MEIKKLYQNRKWLKYKYLEEKLSAYQIAELCGVVNSTVYYWLKKFNITIRPLCEANSLGHQSEEWKSKQRESHKGEKCWIYGNHHSKKTKEKISEAHMGKIFSKEHRKNLSESQMGYIPWNKGKNNVYSKEILQLMSESHIRLQVGKDNPNWRGGVTLLKKRIRDSFKYRQWRSDIFTRDDFTCQECGRRGRRLQVHHIKSFSSILQYYEITTLEEALECEELWNINNGVTLCYKCHRGNELHKGMIKTNGKKDSQIFGCTFAI